MDEEKEKFSPPIENGAIENEEQMSEESDDFDANDAGISLFKLTQCPSVLLFISDIN